MKTAFPLKMFDNIRYLIVRYNIWRCIQLNWYISEDSVPLMNIFIIGNISNSRVTYLPILQSIKFNQTHSVVWAAFEYVTSSGPVIWNSIPILYWPRKSACHWLGMHGHECWVVGRKRRAVIKVYKKRRGQHERRRLTRACRGGGEVQKYKSRSLSWKRLGNKFPRLSTYLPTWTKCTC